MEAPYIFGYEGDEMQALFEKVEAMSGGIVNTTHAGLMAMRNAAGLSPGKMYRITDYVTMVDETPENHTGFPRQRSALHPFDIIVMATAAGTLSEHALAAQHDGDTYFSGQHLSAWRLSYCLDNDADRFPWADTDSGKGVVYWMRDENGNEAPYDFKNVLFLRFNIKGPAGIDSKYWNNPVGGYFYTRDISQAPVMRCHCYDGYYTESAIADKKTDDWQGTYVLSKAGTRMFVVLAGYFNFDIIAEVDKGNPRWIYTFTDTDSDTDATMEGWRDNVVRCRDTEDNGLPNVVFLDPLGANTADGCRDCTFGQAQQTILTEVSNTVIEESLFCSYENIGDGWFDAHQQCRIRNVYDSHMCNMLQCYFEACSIQGSNTYFDVDQTQAAYMQMCGLFHGVTVEMYEAKAFTIVSISEDGQPTYFVPSEAGQ